jgi:hypothetical protein
MIKHARLNFVRILLTYIKQKEHINEIIIEFGYYFVVHKVCWIKLNWGLVIIQDTCN